MAQSLIGLYDGNKVDYIYVVKDSGLSDVGLKLQLWYNKFDKIEELMKLKCIYRVYKRLKPMIDVKDEQVLGVMFSVLCMHKATGWCYVPKNIRKPKRVEVETFLSMPVGEENYKYLYSCMDCTWYICDSNFKDAKMWNLSKLLKDSAYLKLFNEREGYKEDIERIQTQLKEYKAQIKDDKSIELKANIMLAKDYRIKRDGTKFLLYKHEITIAKGNIYEVVKKYAEDYIKSKNEQG